MRLTLKPSLLKRFNTPETLVVISSFPKTGEEVAKDNAVSRYSHLLFSHFPKNKSVVILCEKSETISNEPFLLNKNLLIIPTFTKRSKRLFQQLHKQLSVFNQVSNVHLQFEFSIYGSIPVSMGFVPFLQLLKMQGKYLSVTLHQVVSDINTLAPHVGLKKDSLQTQTINTGLHLFYRSLLNAVDTVIVHDEQLKNQLDVFGEEKKIIVIPHGIKSEKKISLLEQQRARKKFGFKRNEKVILAYGYKSWYKGTDWVVDQLSTFKTKNTKQYRLLLAGDYSPTQYGNPKYQDFKYKLEKKVFGLHKKIVNTGFIPEKEVRQIFAAADVVVFPYRARMSASGALSLAWQYQKPFLVSNFSAGNMVADDIKPLVEKFSLKKKDYTFSLKQNALKTSLSGLNNSKKTQNSLSKLGAEITAVRSWEKTAQLYAETTIENAEVENESFSFDFSKFKESAADIFSSTTRPLLALVNSSR